jgi:hypothetical protein
MLGRQETEGVLGKSRTTGYIPDWGQLLSNGTGIIVSGDGWPFRVSDRYVKALQEFAPAGESGARSTKDSIGQSKSLR